MSKAIKHMLFVTILLLWTFAFLALFANHAFPADTTRIYKIDIGEITYEVLIPTQVPEMDIKLAITKFLGGNVWWLRYCDGILPDHDHMDLIFHWDGGVQFIALAWIHASEKKVDYWVYDHNKMPIPADLDAVLAKIEKYKTQGLI